MAADRKFGLLVELKSDIKKFQTGMGKAQTGVQKMVSSLKTMGVAMLAAFSVKAIGSFIKSISQLYNIQAKSEALLLTALKGREDIQGRLMKQASELQKITLFGDEETIAAQAMLASMGLEEEAIKRLIPLVQDLATAKGMDLRAAADLVAKSVGSSTNAMSRYGIEITGAIGSSERLNTACENLSKAFKGQSEAAAEAGTGGITQLKNALGDVKELMVEVAIETGNLNERAGELAITISEIDWEKVTKGAGEALKVFTNANAVFLLIKTNLKGIVALLPKKAGEEGEAPYYGTERTGIKARELPSVPSLPFMGVPGGGAMTLEDMEELHEVYVKNQELLEASAGYMDETRESILAMNSATKEATEDIWAFIPAMEEEANVIDESTGLIQEYNESFAQTVDWASVVIGAITDVGNAFRTMAEDGKVSMKGLLSVVIDTVGAMIQAYMALTIAKVIAKESEKGLFGLITAAVGVAGFMALWHGLVPDFAAGGLVYGDTMARVGEYPGARSNPEVIAPLNKLKDIMGIGGEVIFRQEGAELVGVLKAYDNRNKLFN